MREAQRIAARADEFQALRELGTLEHCSRYQTAGSTPCCRTTYRAQARTSAERSLRDARLL
ncbi:hypothetical protein [Streptomyces canarius]